jgi:hypothetical protein
MAKTEAVYFGREFSGTRATTSEKSWVLASVNVAPVAIQIR